MAAFDIETPTELLGPAITGVGRFNAAPTSLVTTTYRQRAYNMTLDQFVFWTTQGSPDLTGTLSGYPVANLTDITVLTRTVQ